MCDIKLIKGEKKTNRKKNEVNDNSKANVKNRKKMS